MSLRKAVSCVALLAACGELEIGSYPTATRVTGEAGENNHSSAGANHETPPAGSGGERNDAGHGTTDGSGGDGGTGEERENDGGAPNPAGGASSDGGLSGARDSPNGGISGADESPDGISGAGHSTDGGVSGADNTSGNGSTDDGSAGDDVTHAGAGGVSGDDTGWSNDPSCYGIEEQCPDFLTCCDPAYVPTQAFTLGDGDFAVDARVTLFYPDVLEVTVGRFARFMDDFDSWIASGHPQVDEGEHLYIRNSGWQAEWPIPVSRRAIEQNAMSCAPATYAVRDTNPELPMTCVSWYEAFAFCIWDGKRLLTEAEWELLAKGGEQDRLYPWGNEPEPDPDYASFECRLAGPAFDCEIGDVPEVGSKPLGMSYDGLHDMGGSAAEWVLDLVSDHYENPCNDCANLENERYPTARVFRGGGYASPAERLRTEPRNSMEAASRVNFLGFRCARNSVNL